jgi:hypothetical protein
MVHSEKSAYTEYVDPKRDEWTTKIQSALKKAPLIVLVGERGKSLSRRTDRIEGGSQQAAPQDSRLAGFGPKAPRPHYLVCPLGSRAAPAIRFSSCLAAVSN